MIVELLCAVLVETVLLLAVLVVLIEHAYRHRRLEGRLRSMRRDIAAARRIRHERTSPALPRFDTQQFPRGKHAR